MTIPEELKGDAEGYILFVGTIEAIEATNPDDVNATAVNSDRLENALELADMQICATDTIACIPGKLLIRKQYKLLQYKIARWLLDTLKQREDIKEGYEDVLDTLKAACSDEVCAKEPDLTAEEAEELGVVLCPNITISSEGRIWTRKTLSTFREGRFTNGGFLSSR